jgi:hypothetical protein
LVPYKEIIGLSMEVADLGKARQFAESGAGKKPKTPLLLEMRLLRLWGARDKIRA